MKELEDAVEVEDGRGGVVLVEDERDGPRRW